MGLEWSSLWISGTPTWLGLNAKLLTLSSHQTLERSCSLPAPELDAAAPKDSLRGGQDLFSTMRGQQGVTYSANTEIQIWNPLHLLPPSFPVTSPRLGLRAGAHVSAMLTARHLLNTCHLLIPHPRVSSRPSAQLYSNNLIEN